MSEVQRSIRLDQIEKGVNPRTYFDPYAMSILVESVKTSGVMTPIMVRPLNSGKFQIIAGERRWRASLEVFGPEGEIPTVIRECSDAEAEVLALVENTVRDDMSPTEEAEAAHKIFMRCKGDRQETLAYLGWKDMQKLDRRLALMRLTPEVRTALTTDKIMLGHAELLAALPSDRQNSILDKIVAHSVPVAQLKAQLGRMANKLAEAIFDKADCLSCIHNSGQQTAMFAENIGDGSCTNKVCWDEKESTHLVGIAAALKDSVPRVELIRSSDEFPMIKLVAVGKLGVGEEQAKSCKGCANFGCTVSAIPGSLGEVEQEICFDTTCNTEKVTAHIKAEAAIRKAAESASKAVKAKGGTESDAKAAGEKAAKTAKKASAAKAVGAISKGIKEYREATWKAVAAKVLYANPVSSACVLVALGLCSKGRDLDSIKLGDVFTKLGGAKEGSFHALGAAATAVGAAGDGVREGMLTAMAASAMKGSSESDVRGVLGFLAVELGQHWSLNDEFMKLLTKSEIEALCEEVGLSEAMGKAAFQKALGGKKDDLIKAVLAVSGFVYEGVVPKCMRFDNTQTQSVDGGESLMGGGGGDLEDAGEESGSGDGTAEDAETALAG